MKLVSFSSHTLNYPRLGIVRGTAVIDVKLAGQALGLVVPDQMLDLLDNYAQSGPSLQVILAAAGDLDFSQVAIFNEPGIVHDLSAVALDAPIPHPRKNIACMAVNYRDHAQETAAIRNRSAEAAVAPILFTKAPTTINSPYGSIVIDPRVSTEIDWEVELGVIIGKAGKNIRAEDALEHVFGYTVLNDITARDLQARHKQFFKGKSLDGYCPMGPWIVTADEIVDPHNLVLQLRINGQLKQDGNTAQMIFSIPQIIETLSFGMTLEAGDIIATGTPGGVGFSRNPPEFLQPGDILESEIVGIGMMRNPIIGIISR